MNALKSYIRLLTTPQSDVLSDQLKDAPKT